jgi:hypothetical protein
MQPSFWRCVFSASARRSRWCPGDPARRSSKPRPRQSAPAASVTPALQSPRPFGYVLGDVTDPAHCARVRRARARTDGTARAGAHRQLVHSGAMPAWNAMRRGEAGWSSITRSSMCRTNCVRSNCRRSTWRRNARLRLEIPCHAGDRGAADAGNRAGACRPGRNAARRRGAAHRHRTAGAAICASPCIFRRAGNRSGWCCLRSGSCAPGVACPSPGRGRDMRRLDRIRPRSGVACIARWMTRPVTWCAVTTCIHCWHAHHGWYRWSPDLKRFFEASQERFFAGRPLTGWSRLRCARVPRSWNGRRSHDRMDHPDAVRRDSSSRLRSGCSRSRWRCCRCGRVGATRSTTPAPTGCRATGSATRCCAPDASPPRWPSGSGARSGRHRPAGHRTAADRTRCGNRHRARPQPQHGRSRWCPRGASR